VDLIPESDSRIQQWTVAGERILILTGKDMDRQIQVFDLAGRKTEEVIVNPEETFKITGAAPESDEVFLERESFTDPIRIVRYSPVRKECALWAKKIVPTGLSDVCHTQIWYPSKDGTKIPMYIVGRREVVTGGCHPAIMTSYGGYGVSMTPQFSVFVAFLIERGCLFALPNIRGGSEFGAAWHNAAKRRNRQTAYDDFLSAAEWLIQMGRTTADKLAIFGGSNSGLLVGAAMTQRPDQFRAVVCMVPMLDMLRYHLFDNAHVWSEEFGTAEDREDFEALHRYSPYHQVRDGVPYPATMIVSGDADRNCNPLHARKMTARLQAANSSGLPVFLDYSPFRGHSPVLPLSERVEALTDRMTFLCEQLELTA
jgi:prolyl oligopeptidase